ncbi:uncharacterized protein LOC115361741 [Myripristis murdjan]|uniref:uncharacterized protein LOC115361741 n=1 Tax=Myripristis murdjan TaxID=586833 RepID=UPI001176331F|nr:uncharacterized protein LOC115361741 [Myripristis murdjan]
MLSRENGCVFVALLLYLSDLQVKVTPVAAAEGQRVTLICSTSCPLTENPAAYIWYKNGSFVYQDSSPWYHQLVSSEEAVSYSCAVKGYEDLRAAEVSVDSVTPTCFSVTYAGGRMCSSNQRCSITYPRELHVEVTPAATSGQFVTLTCNSSCNVTDTKPENFWYKNGEYLSSDPQLNVSRSSDDSYSCAVSDNEDIRSPAVCADGQNCWSVNYVSRRICALEGSSVDIYCNYSYPSDKTFQPTDWYKTSGMKPEILNNAAPHVEYDDNMNQNIMRIKNLTKSDSAEYKCYNSYTKWSYSRFPGVTLVVTGLEVVVTPSEDQKVTLTCSTSCPLTDNTYIWYHNGRPLTLAEGQHKQLVLDSVSAQHAGNYSCAVRSHQNIKSPEETPTVRGPSWTLAAAAGIAAALLLVILLSIFLWIRRKRTSTQTPGPEAQEDTEQLNHPPVHSSISAVGQEPIRAAQSKPAEQDELHYSTLHFSKKNPLYSTNQLSQPQLQPQPQPEEEVQYAAVNIRSADIVPRFTVSTGDEYCTVHKKTKNKK